jgi:ABC-type branched-subunit amino acid transport system substrate-binding protein
VKARLIAVGMVLALVAGACGSRVSTQDIEAADAGSGRNGVAQQPGGPAATAPPGEQSTEGMFGTLASPCGPGDASGATDIGVTDTEIKIVTIADPGGLKPGLNQGVFDSMKAFEQWCNEQGGINGRLLKVELRDAKLTEYQAQVRYGCENAFSLVGGIGVLDETGAQDQVDCRLPNVPAAAVSPEQTGADFTYQPMPNPANSYLVGPARWVAREYPDAITRAAALRTKLSITEAQSNRLMEAYETEGFNFTYVDSSNIGETNWAPLVLAMKNQGIEYMTLTSSFEEIIPLQREMALQGFSPEIVELETNFYNLKYPQQAGPVADGTVVRLTVWPFEEADQNPAMAEFLRALERAVPKAESELLAVQAWSAALLWATAVKELGSDVTRQGLLEKLSEVHEWDGGGLHGRSDPGARKPAPCYLILRVEDGGFVRQYPLPDRDAEVYEQGKGFDCDPDNVVALAGSYGAGAKAKN